MRARRSLIACLLLVSLLAAGGVASASKTETRPSSVTLYRGSDWVGRVLVGYSPYTERRVGTGPPELSYVRFANECNRRGTAFTGSITVHGNGQFAYRGHGLTISGHVIGSLSNPREIAGLAGVTARGCTSGPWWFSAR